MSYAYIGAVFRRIGHFVIQTRIWSEDEYVHCVITLIHPLYLSF